MQTAEQLARVLIRIGLSPVEITPETPDTDGVVYMNKNVHVQLCQGGHYKAVETLKNGKMVFYANDYKVSKLRQTLSNLRENVIHGC